MSYQAVIRNATGALVTSHAVGMRISILQGSATGTTVYVETQTPTTNANGLMTIEIGVGTVVTGTFAGIDWSTGVYFIKTETDPTGGTSYTITGTSQVLSVPYSFYAKTAGNGSLWSQSGSNIYYNNGKEASTGKMSAQAQLGITSTNLSLSGQTNLNLELHLFLMLVDLYYLLDVRLYLSEEHLPPGWAIWLLVSGHLIPL